MVSVKQTRTFPSERPRPDRLLPDEMHDPRPVSRGVEPVGDPAGFPPGLEDAEKVVSGEGAKGFEDRIRRRGGFGSFLPRKLHLL